MAQTCFRSRYDLRRGKYLVAIGQATHVDAADLRVGRAGQRLAGWIKDRGRPDASLVKRAICGPDATESVVLVRQPEGTADSRVLRRDGSGVVHAVEPKGAVGPVAAWFALITVSDGPGSLLPAFNSRTERQAFTQAVEPDVTRNEVPS